MFGRTKRLERQLNELEERLKYADKRIEALREFVGYNDTLWTIPRQISSLERHQNMLVDYLGLYYEGGKPRYRKKK